jgi:hypothetical protein
MKLVMTLRARDEADVVDANVAFHLNAGVDLVIAADLGAEEASRDVLEAYARQGYVQLREETEMARLAYGEFRAEWVISGDSNEFWWPRGGSLKEVLASVPERYGDVRALVRQFVPRLEDGSFFAERMVERMRTANGASPKSIYRAAHTLAGSEPVPLRGWYPIEVLRFPTRAALQSTELGNGDHDHVVDTRLRDALRVLRVSEGDRAFGVPEAGRSRLSFPRPTVVDDAAYAVEIAALGEGDLARVRKRLEELEGRLAALEQVRPAARLRREVTGAAKRLLRVARARAT